MQLGGCADFLRLFIWNHVSSLMQLLNQFKQQVCIKFCKNLGKSAMVILAVMSLTLVFEWHVQTPGPKTERQVKNKVKSMLVIFFDI
jgi:hypothetical protein